MTSRLRHIGDRLVTLRPGEGTTALLMFLYSFLAMTAYNVLRPVTRSQVIGALGADNLPYVQLGASLIIGLLMQGYGRAAGRVPRRLLIPLTQLGEVGLLLVFWVLFLTGAAWVSVAFYVLGLILGILLISQFWTLANDIYDARAAKRVFGFIGGGASLGGATGAAITAAVVHQVGTSNLLLVSAAILALCAGIVALIVRRRDTITAAVPAAERSVRGGEAIRLLRSSRHLQIIALVIGSAAVGAAIIDQQLNMAAESISGAGATDTITRFLAQVTFYVSIIGFAIQVGLTSRIHRNLGLGVALLILPIGLGATAAAILVSGAIWAAALARVLDASLRYTVDKTTREVLYLPLPAAIKYLAKPFVDVTVDRFAKALGALLVLVLIKPWGFGLDWRQLSYASLAVTAAWIVFGLIARREYLRSFRRSLGERAIAPASVRLTVADTSTIETLVEELASSDDDAVIYAIDLLDTLDKRHLITPLLLHHESARVRARALEALDATSPTRRARWAPLVERMLRDTDADVRAAAVKALALFGTESATSTMKRYVDDPEPRVAATAATVLAASGNVEEVALAEETFSRLLSDARPAAVEARREAAAALGRVSHPRLRPMLVPLLLDPDVSVAEEAMRAVRRGGECDPLFVPALVARLSHRRLKQEARETLLSGGAAVVDPLAYLLHDPDEQPWVRRHIPATLGRLPVQASVDALLRALEDADGFIRYKALEAIERIHRSNEELHLDRGALIDLVTFETGRYYGYLVLRQNLLSGCPGCEDTLVAQALDDKLRRATDRIFRVLGLLHPWKDVAAARDALQHGNARARADAAEYLDNLLDTALRRRVLPILEDIPIEERLRHAYAVLKTRPRDVDETLVRLVHGDDPVLASAAIHFVSRSGMASLWPDIEFILRHGTSDPSVKEAASWALASRSLPVDGAAATGAVMPIIEVTSRLRAIALFALVPIEELFRVAISSRRVAYPAGHRLCHADTALGTMILLLDGSVHDADGRAPRGLDGPCALAAEDALAGRPSARSIDAATGVQCLEIDLATFLAMLGESLPLAQGVFRMLLDGADDRVWDRAEEPVDRVRRADPSLGMQAIDKVLLLREHPLFRRASVDQLLELAAVTQDVTVAPGTSIGPPSDPPGTYYVIAGEVQVDASEAGRVVVSAGNTVGAVGVLTGRTVGWRLTAVTPAHLLCVPASDLFRVVADHGDLLQAFFCAALEARTAVPA